MNKGTLAKDKYHVIRVDYSTQDGRFNKQLRLTGNAWVLLPDNAFRFCSLPLAKAEERTNWYLPVAMQLRTQVPIPSTLSNSKIGSRN